LGIYWADRKTWTKNIKSPPSNLPMRWAHSDGRLGMKQKKNFTRRLQTPRTMARLSFNLKLCDEYKRTPPPETWDGVIALDEK